VAARNDNLLQLATPQVWAFGLERILARLQMAEVVSPILCGGCGGLGAGGLIAQGDADALKRV
jgi:hypothetical protein